MIIKIETKDVPRDAWVCDYCRTCFIQLPRGYCSSSCYHKDQSRKNYESIKDAEKK